MTKVVLQHPRTVLCPCQSLIDFVKSMFYLEHILCFISTKNCYQKLWNLDAKSSIQYQLHWESAPKIGKSIELIGQKLLLGPAVLVHADKVSAVGWVRFGHRLRPGRPLTWTATACPWPPAPILTSPPTVPLVALLAWPSKLKACHAEMTGDESTKCQLCISHCLWGKGRLNL